MIPSFDQILLSSGADVTALAGLISNARRLGYSQWSHIVTLLRKSSSYRMLASLQIYWVSI